jgi:hypothetical protein
MTAPKSSLGERPSRMKPADLGSAFGGSSRSDGLGGRLTPLRSTPAPLTPEASAESVHDVATPKLLETPETPDPVGNRAGESVVKTTRKPAPAAHPDAPCRWRIPDHRGVPGPFGTRKAPFGCGRPHLYRGCADRSGFQLRQAQQAVLRARPAHWQHVCRPRPAADPAEP